MSGHKCKTCFVHCMDFRFQKAFGELLESLGVKPGDFDRLSIPGGAGNFEKLKEYLTLSKDLHAARQFILTIHEDCGAGAKKEDLKEAVRIAKEVLPEAEIKTFYVSLDGAIQ